jgi:hypothetical protein
MFQASRHGTACHHRNVLVAVPSLDSLCSSPWQPRAVRAVAAPLHRQQVSGLLPQNFEDTTIRVYTRDPDPDKVLCAMSTSSMFNAVMLFGGLEVLQKHCDDELLDLRLAFASPSTPTPQLTFPPMRLRLRA